MVVCSARFACFVVAALLVNGVAIAEASATEAFVDDRPLGGVAAPDPPPAVRTRPEIDEVAPTSGPAGAAVTIVGRGFSDVAIAFGEERVARATLKSFVGVACTISPECRGGVRQRLELRVPPLRPGRYPIRVENGGGRSNTVWFVVTKF